MECQEGFEIDVTDTIAISQHEGVVLQQRLESQEAPAGQSFETSFDQVDLPVASRLAMRCNLSGGKIDGQTAVQSLEIEEVTLDHLALVAKRDDEFTETLFSIYLHDVPEKRTATNFHHRLRHDGCLLSQARTETARQDDDFHESLTSSVCM